MAKSAGFAVATTSAPLAMFNVENMAVFFVADRVDADAGDDVGVVAGRPERGNTADRAQQSLCG